MKKVLVGLFMVGSVIAAWSSEHVIKKGVAPGKWTQDYAAARKYAKEKNLPLLLNFTGSDWCGWCKLMDKNVFAKPEWQKYAKDNLVLVWIDFPQDKSKVPKEYEERNQKLSAEFGVKGYPTYIIVDGKTGDVLGRLGAGRDKTPKGFISDVKGILRYTDAGVEKFVSKLSPEKKKVYLKLIKEMKESKKALKELKENYLKEEARLEKVIEEKNEAIEQEHIDAKVKELPAAKREVYKKLVTDLKKTEKSLKDWFATRPSQNEANQKKYMKFMKDIKTLKGKLGEFD